MSTFWSIWVIVLTVGSIISYVWILCANRKTTNKPGETTGHSYDGIEEYDNPLPAWWFWKFIILVVFSIGYLIYYPGLGNFKGIGGWTSVGELRADEAAYEAKFAPLFAKYRDVPVVELAKDPDVMKMGQRLFATNCSVCHGSTATGSQGFPNLTDDVWLWGGTPEAIEQTIAHGRTALMPAHKAQYKEEQIWDLVSYVEMLAGSTTQDQEQVDAGKVLFEQGCFACHGMDGKGNPAMGAPDLTNNNWLYGSRRMDIEMSIANGRNGIMPAFTDRLGQDKVHILAAYVYQLSQATDK